MFRAGCAVVLFTLRGTFSALAGTAERRARLPGSGDCGSATGRTGQPECPPRAAYGALAEDVANKVVCKEVTAPAAFQIVWSKDAKDAGNDGVKPLGFVDLRSAGPVVHGIDISSYQDEADFTSVKTCGAAFAYVRLSASTYKDNELKYRTHWANVRAAGLVPGPYHNLSVLPREVSNIRALKTDLQGAAISTTIEQARASGGCSMIGPALEEIATEMNGKVKIAKLNVAENPGAFSVSPGFVVGRPKQPLHAPVGKSTY